MKIRELLKITDFNDIANQLKKHYDDIDIEKIHSLYLKLKNNSDFVQCENYSITINAYSVKNDNEDPILLTDFDENDNSLFFDVSAIKESENNVYSISTVNKIEFLNYEISQSTLMRFSNAAILAHCLWEITCYSYD
ncbi:DUF6557 family protein [Ruminococcus flavefaciens]|uniref:DUF6557 family protein n=1 Tax=Ruminococcus flavefaciens TaxID=1265 RepID=UPI0013DC9DBE|nr:DUF6557 family protein [Ruminococcus flavefaciens]